MDSSENLERRVTAVEAEVVVIRQEAAAARALAAGADRDVADYRAEMRAHTRGLISLRETQLDHYAEHKADLAALRETVTADLAALRVTVTADLAALRETMTADLAGMGETMTADLASMGETMTADLATLRETQVEHYAERKTDSIELKAGLAHIVHLLEGPGGRLRRSES